MSFKILYAHNFWNLCCCRLFLYVKHCRLLKIIFEPMRPFIVHMKDVRSDKNCWYRAIANLLDFGEDGWAQVRRDILTELNAFPYLYECVLRGFERLEEISRRSITLMVEHLMRSGWWCLIWDILYHLSTILFYSYYHKLSSNHLSP